MTRARSTKGLENQYEPRFRIFINYQTSDDDQFVLWWLTIEPFFGSSPPFLNCNRVNGCTCVFAKADSGAMTPRREFIAKWIVRNAHWIFVGAERNRPQVLLAICMQKAINFRRICGEQFMFKLKF